MPQFKIVLRTDEEMSVNCTTPEGNDLTIDTTNTHDITSELSTGNLLDQWEAPRVNIRPACRSSYRASSQSIDIRGIYGQSSHSIMLMQQDTNY